MEGLTARLRTVYFHEQRLVIKWFGTKEWDELILFLKFFIIKVNHIHCKMMRYIRVPVPHIPENTVYYKSC